MTTTCGDGSCGEHRDPTEKTTTSDAGVGDDLAVEAVAVVELDDGDAAKEANGPLGTMSRNLRMAESRYNLCRFACPTKIYDPRLSDPSPQTSHGTSDSRSAAFK